MTDAKNIEICLYVACAEESREAVSAAIQSQYKTVLRERAETECNEIAQASKQAILCYDVGLQADLKTEEQIRTFFNQLETQIESIANVKWVYLQITADIAMLFDQPANDPEDTPRGKPKKPLHPLQRKVQEATRAVDTPRGEDVYTRVALQKTLAGNNLSLDWHLKQIRAPEAWQKIKQKLQQKPGQGMLLAQLDTGYFAHESLPDATRLLEDKSIDFRADKTANTNTPTGYPRAYDRWDFDGQTSASSNPLEDQASLLMAGIHIVSVGLEKFWPAKGHGTGTMGIAAANVPAQHADLDSSNDIAYMGVAPAISVIPYRVATSVVLNGNKELASAIYQAICEKVDVITISLGGIPSPRWLEALYAAYQAGIVVCAAAGNNVLLPLGARTPRSVVYPARFPHTIAVSGMMHTGEPYWIEDAMSGNWGKNTDICAPTPKVPWAKPLEKSALMDQYVTGQGTSAATPQVAAAAALWLQYYREELKDFSGPERIEACRWALLSSANKNVTKRTNYQQRYEPDTTKNRLHFGLEHSNPFGYGCLDIASALDVKPNREHARRLVDKFKEAMSLWPKDEIAKVVFADPDEERRGNAARSRHHPHPHTNPDHDEVRGGVVDDNDPDAER